MRIATLLMLSALISGHAEAGPIFKSVDRDGKVTYAAQPLPDAISAEPLVPDAPPSAEQVREAEEQAEAIASLNARRDRERKEAAKEAAELRAAVSQTIIVERPYLLPVPYSDRWWGVPVIAPERPIRPPRSHAPPPPASVPRAGGGVRR